MQETSKPYLTPLHQSSSNNGCTGLVALATMEAQEILHLAYRCFTKPFATWTPKHIEMRRNKTICVIPKLHKQRLYCRNSSIYVVFYGCWCAGCSTPAKSRVKAELPQANSQASKSQGLCALLRHGKDAPTTQDMGLLFT